MPHTPASAIRCKITPIHAGREKYFPPFWAKCAKKPSPQRRAFAESGAADDYPFRLAASRQATFPKGTAYCGDGKVPGRAQRLPLGGAVAQRLRGYKWRIEKSVKALAPTGAALAFLCFDFFCRIVKGVQPLETGCGTQHPLRALGGTRVLLAAAPTTPPCFRRWRRSSSLLLRGGWSPEVGRGESEHPSLPLAQRSVYARCWQAETFPAERISNRPAPGGLHHKIRAFGNTILRKIALFQRHPPRGKIRVACTLPRL